jgi:hypothetical protein
MASLNQGYVDKLHGGGSSSSSNPFQQTKPIYDKSGKLVGIDTGTQSRLPTNAEQIMYGKKPSSGGSGGEGSSYVAPSGQGYETSPTGVTTEVKQVQTTPTKSNFEKIIEKKSPIFDVKTFTEPRVNRIEPVIDYGFVKPYQISGGEAVKQTIQNVGYNIKEFFGDREYRDTFEPFGRSNLGSIKQIITPNVNPLGLNFQGISFNPKTSGEINSEVGMKYGKGVEEIKTGITKKGEIYSTVISEQAQKEYESEFNIAQEKVTKGEWNLESGKKYLDIVSGSIESKYKTNLEDYNKQLQSEFSTSIKPLEEEYKKGRANEIKRGIKL